MSAVRTAIHLRTGESHAAEEISAWLRDHRVEVTGFSDAYDLCVHLLQHSAEIPDLALVGADWLSPGEFAIVRYLRETWPGVGIVVYSSGGETPPCEPGPLTRVCRSSHALRQLLSESPERTLSRLRQEASLEAPQAAARSRADRPAAIRETPSQTPASAPGASAAKPNGPPIDRDEQADGSKPGPAADQPPRGILTDEELSALLDDEGT